MSSSHATLRSLRFLNLTCCVTWVPLTRHDVSLWVLELWLVCSNMARHIGIRFEQKRVGTVLHGLTKLEDPFCWFSNFLSKWHSAPSSRTSIAFYSRFWETLSGSFENSYINSLNVCFHKYFPLWKIVSVKYGRRFIPTKHCNSSW
jgi:hypothetical protein